MPQLPPVHPAAATLVLRLFLGGVLMYGTQDNILSHERMLEFRDFLERNGFPYPLFCAYLSVWAQFLAGLLIVAGAATRIAAAVMVVNFLVAIVMVHWGLPFDANIAVLAMLFCSLFLVLNGAGPWSVDARLAAGRDGVDTRTREPVRVHAGVR